ncbi:hypothetical protein [Kluyvera genomosp. 3]|uniref:Uncharacterized protein n=1 Tax=Kluyvera genomosp. 3 TaxID=2774055 RepID=A0A6G9RIB6_9ENTR|nr:hypothetical protein [Kluyvera genomosp. 3]EJH4367108.1 hypothetical protein [Salmonella enterica subsp. enterica serovar Bareilly]QIR26706.1 hypothetical protein GY169_07690 [Kluyvera genomosp. 3]
MINQNNPVAPLTAPEANDLLNMYQQQAAALRGEAKAQDTGIGNNPFQSGAGQQDEQKAHMAKQEQFLAPIGSNIFDPVSDYTEEKHQRFLKNLNNDPAFNEIENPYHEFLSNLKMAQDAGKISPQDAISMLSEYGQNEIDPILDKHHGKHSPTHKTTLHDQDEFIPDIVKRAKGAK